MAFPTVQDADTKNGVQTSNSTSWTLTYPTNIASGDLLLAFVATDGNNLLGAPTWPGGWQQVQNGAEVGGAVTLLSYGKVADGTETGTFTLTLNASEQGAWRIFRITGWYGSSLANADGAVTQGTSENPDPPNLNPDTAGWDIADTLWFAACAVDTSRTISVYPLAGRNTADVSGGAGGATLGLCTTTSAVAALDPGTFTVSSSDQWVATTVAVRPAAGGEPPAALATRKALLGVGR